MNHSVFPSNSAGFDFQGTWTTKRDAAYPGGSVQIGTLEQNAQVYYTFTGTAVYLFADLNIDADLMFSVDSFVYSAQVSTLANTSSSAPDVQCVFALQALSPSEHTLLAMPASQPHGYPGSALILSSIIYTDSSTPNDSSSTSSSSSSQKSATGSTNLGATSGSSLDPVVGAAAATASSPSSSSPTSASSSKHSLSTGVIVGIVAGVLALIIFCFLCWWLYRKVQECLKRPKMSDVVSAPHWNMQECGFFPQQPPLLPPPPPPPPPPRPPHQQWFRRTYLRDYEYVLSQYAPYRSQLCEEIRGVISEPLRNRIKDTQNTFEAMEMLFAAEIGQNIELQRVVVEFAWEKDDLRFLLRDWHAMKN